MPASSAGQLGPSLFAAHQLCKSLGIDLDTLLGVAVPVARSVRPHIA